MASRHISSRALLATVLFAPLSLAAQQRYWYDGDTRRPLWAESGVIADFDGAAREKSGVLKPAGLVKSGAAGTSPVYRDQPGDTGSARALPGGVLLRFKPGTAEAQRDALLSRHGLTRLREVGTGTDAVLVASAPGDASLTLANRLHESGDFAAASPNWWRPHRRK